MKPILLFLFVSGMNLFAQTNSMFFQTVTDTNGIVLATNVEFRCFNGSRVCFLRQDEYQVFPASQLNSNVLARLGTTLEKLEASQKDLDLKTKHYREWRDAQARMIAQQQAADAAAQKAKLEKEKADSEERRRALPPAHRRPVTVNQEDGAF